MTPTEASSNQPFRFCDLPPEIRNMVYRLLLVADEDITLTLRRTSGNDSRPVSEITNKERPRLQPAILRTNRHICAEGVAVLYRGNCFTVCLMQDWIGYLHMLTLITATHKDVKTHPHFPLMIRLHLILFVPSCSNLDHEKVRVEKVRATVEIFIRTLVDRKPLDVLKVSLLDDGLSTLKRELYDRVLGPLSLLQSLRRLEVAPELSDSLPNTLSSLREKGDRFQSDFDADEGAVSDGHANVEKETYLDSDCRDEEEEEEEEATIFDCSVYGDDERSFEVII